MLSTSNEEMTEAQVAKRQRPPRSKEVRAVGEVLRTYAENGSFRSFSEGKLRVGKMPYRMVWHYNREYQLLLEIEASSLSFPGLLPGVRAGSAVHKDLRQFLKLFTSDEMPEHRRVDPNKGEILLIAKRGALTLGISIKNGEYEYCTRRLIHIVQEVFMVFLNDGPYYEYRIEQLGLDPDVAWA
jgi:hypothetical protein